MEDYDQGGSGVAYSDKSAANEGNVYREDGVDVVGLGCTDTLNTEGCTGYAVGYTNPGEWFEFTFNAVIESEFLFRAHVSSGAENSSFMLYVDGNAVTDTIVVPQGDDWDTYKDVNGKIAKITKGDHVLRVKITGSFVNLDWIKFALTEAELEETQKIAYNVYFPTNSSYGIYNIKGRQVGAVLIMGAPTTETLVREMNAMGLKSGCYIVRNVSARFNKLIQLR